MFKVHLEKVDFGRVTNVYVTKIKGDKFVNLYMHDGASVREVCEEGVKIQKPFFSIPSSHTEILQSLIDELLGAGIKPSEELFTKGKLEATERHLEDMRRLVFREPTEYGSLLDPVPTSEDRT